MHVPEAMLCLVSALAWFFVVAAAVPAAPLEEVCRTGGGKNCSDQLDKEDHASLLQMRRTDEEEAHSIFPFTTTKSVNLTEVCANVTASKGITAVVINLKARKDRWATVSKSLRTGAPCMNFTRLDAVNGKADPPVTNDVSETWDTTRMAKLVNVYEPMVLNMSVGERGCCASHLKAWRLAANMERPLVVLEDDAVVLPNFTETLEQAVNEATDDTSIIFLSNMDRGAPTPVSKLLQKPWFVWTTVGYVISPQGARQFLSMLPLDMPVDNWLAWYINQGKIKAFALQNSAFKQAASWNVASDVAHSDDIAHPEGMAENIDDSISDDPAI